MRVVVVIELLFVACGWSIAQECFQWGVQPGMHLRYEVEAYDTVTFDGQPTLFRHRNERWLVVCDSSRGDTLHLSQRLELFEAREVTSDGDSSMRTGLPAIGHAVHIAMTRRGQRLSVEPLPTRQLSILPGGTFGPVLLLPLDSFCTKCGRLQWISEQQDTTVEYAFPPPTIERMFIATVDSCTDDGTPLRITYAETSRGVHVLRTERFALQTVAWILANGVVMLDPHDHVPRSIAYSQQIRFTAKHDDDHSPRHGQQRTALHIRLVQSGNH